MQRSLALAAVIGAGCNVPHYQTHAFVAPQPCGQGPYDFHVALEGHHPEGVDIIACTPHKLAGYAQVSMNQLKLYTEPFGDTADNQRCLGGGPIAVATTAATPATTMTDMAGATESDAGSQLVEQGFIGKDVQVFSDDELCQPYGLSGQTVFRTQLDDDLFVHPGNDLHVRIWSDAPNDLEHVVFLMRDVRWDKKLAKAEVHVVRPGEKVAEPPPRRDHGPPPPALAEQRPPEPSAGATWIAGSWTWTGSQWGWSSGFWRDAEVATPAPRIEVPGAPPAPNAVWIAGGWQLRAGSWVWVGGRWR
jgi:hypothetical protein